MPSSIGDLLQNDDGIDALTDAQVRDVWARATLAKYLFRNRLFQDRERHYTPLLTEGDESDLYVVASDALPASHSLLGKLRPDVEESYNTEQLFDHFTVDEADLNGDHELMDVARSKLKVMLRGSGMPRMKVARRRLEYLLE